MTPLDFPHSLNPSSLPFLPAPSPPPPHDTLLSQRFFSSTMQVSHRIRSYGSMNTANWVGPYATAGWLQLSGSIRCSWVGLYAVGGQQFRSQPIHTYIQPAMQADVLQHATLHAQGHRTSA